MLSCARATEQVLRPAFGRQQLEYRGATGEILWIPRAERRGKTTTIRMALGLITPSAGSVEILGHEVASQRAVILPRVGALVETPALYLYMSGRNNLRAIASVLGGVPEARLDDVLDLVQLRGRDNDRVKTYSLGMKQRLGVAMALLQDPDLLILDEPANGLDPAGIVEMRDLMRRLASEGKTVFISSHVLTEVRQICTRVAILNFGRSSPRRLSKISSRGMASLRSRLSPRISMRRWPSFARSRGDKAPAWTPNTARSSRRRRRGTAAISICSWCMRASHPRH